jgi:hypothetical protein
MHNLKCCEVPGDETQTVAVRYARQSENMKYLEQSVFRMLNYGVTRAWRISCRVQVFSCTLLSPQNVSVYLRYYHWAPRLSGLREENWKTEAGVLMELEAEYTVPMAVPWLRPLVACLPLRRPEFDPGSVHVVDKVTMGQDFLQVLRFFSC